MILTKESNEIWKDIPGYGNFYMASSLGRIKCKQRIVEKMTRNGRLCKQLYRERILSGCADELGYARIHLGFNGKKVSRAVHSLVLEAFVGPRPDGMECCHNNSIPGDNRPSNLRWDSHFENNQDRVRRGSYLTGQNHKMAKLSLEDVAALRRGEKTWKEVGVTKSHAWGIRKLKSWNTEEIIRATT